MKSVAYLVLASSLLFNSYCPAQGTGDLPLPTRINTPELFRAIQAAKLEKKGDEEKTSSFEQRKASFRHKGLALDSEMMAVFRPNQFKEDCFTSFDADKDEYSFACNFKEQTHEAHGMLIPIQQSAPSDSTYVAANAFNRKVIVKKRNVTRFGLLLNPEPGKFFKGNTTLNVSELKAPAGKLKRDYEQFEVGVIFKLEPPYIDRFTSGTEPTIDNPFDLTINSSVIVGTPLRVYLFQRGETRPFKTLNVTSEATGTTAAFIKAAFVEASE